MCQLLLDAVCIEIINTKGLKTGEMSMKHSILTTIKQASLHHLKDLLDGSYVSKLYQILNCNLIRGH